MIVSVGTVYFYYDIMMCFLNKRFAKHLTFGIFTGFY